MTTQKCRYLYSADIQS